MPPPEYPTDDKMAATTAAAAPTEPPPSFESHFEYYGGQPHSRDFQPPPPAFPAQRPAAREGADNEYLAPSLPPYATAARYGRYKTEAEYLAALKAWVEEKACERVGGDQNGLIGFYGSKTMDHYATRPGGVRSGMSSRKKSSSISEQGPGSELQATKSADSTATGEQGRRRKSSISQWLSRRRGNSISEAGAS